MVTPTLLSSKAVQLLFNGAKEVKQEVVLAGLAQQDGMMSADDLAKEMKLRENRVRSFLSRLKTKEQ